ncbi:MAG: 4Fe-4S binding protein [Promethearchaeota archaeon]
MTFKINVDMDKCEGCGSCVDVCPQECYDDVVDGKVVVKSDYECIGCEACANSCPNDAIEITEE